MLRTCTICGARISSITFYSNYCSKVCWDKARDEILMNVIVHGTAIIKAPSIYVETKCECGAEVVGSLKHYGWCPKHGN